MNIPALSEKEALIVRLLAERDMYGLELVAESGGRLRPGTAYVTLGRMINKGLVTSDTDSHLGRERLLRPTGRGMLALEAFDLCASLEDPPTIGDPVENYVRHSLAKWTSAPPSVEEPVLVVVLDEKGDLLFRSAVYHPNRRIWTSAHLTQEQLQSIRYWRRMR